MSTTVTSRWTPEGQTNHKLQPRCAADLRNEDKGVPVNITVRSRTRALEVCIVVFRTHHVVGARRQQAVLVLCTLPKVSRVAVLAAASTTAVVFQRFTASARPACLVVEPANNISALLTPSASVFQTRVWFAHGCHGNASVKSNTNARTHTQWKLLQARLVYLGGALCLHGATAFQRVARGALLVHNRGFKCVCVCGGGGGGARLGSGTWNPSP